MHRIVFDDCANGQTVRSVSTPVAKCQVVIGHPDDVTLGNHAGTAIGGAPDQEVSRIVAIASGKGRGEACENEENAENEGRIDPQHAGAMHRIPRPVDPRIDRKASDRRLSHVS